MSERGQKIFKIIVWICILISVILYSYRTYKSFANPSITKTEWETMLEDGFGIAYAPGYGDESVTGRDIAISTMSLVGRERLAYLTEEDVNEDSTLISIAEKYDIVSKKQLNKEFSEEEAEQALNAFLDFYTAGETYPVYQNVVFNKDVVDALDWEIQPVSEDYTTCVIPQNQTVEVGQILIIENTSTETPLAMRVSDVQGGDNGIQAVLEPVETPEEVFDEISFSGYGVIDEENIELDNSIVDGVSVSPSIQSSEFESNGLFEPVTAYAYEFGDSYSTDIIFSLSYKNSNGKQSIGTDISVDGESKTSKNKEFGAEVEHDNWNADGEITGSIELKDFTVLANATILEGDENGAEVILSTDIVNQLDVKGDFDGAWQFATIPVTICGIRDPFDKFNVGTVSADIKFYLVATAEGELKLTYTIDNIKVGASATVGDGFKLIKPSPSSKAEFDAELDLTAGIRSEVDLQAQLFNFDPIDIADPSLTIGAYAHGEKLEQNEGFEDYPECLSLKFAAPTLNVTGINSDDTVLAEVVSKIKELNSSANIVTSKDFLTPENAPIQKEWHIEWDKDWTMTKLDGGDEVCTHVKKGEVIDVDTDDISEKIDDKIEEEENKVIDALLERIAEALDKWFTENCDGCDDC